MKYVTYPNFYANIYFLTVRTVSRLLWNPYTHLNIYANDLHKSTYTQANDDINGALSRRNQIIEPPSGVN